MIYLYSGTPGSGKSLHTARVIHQSLRVGIPVIANFEINTEKIKRKKSEFVFVDNTELTPEFLIDYAIKHSDGKRIKEGSGIISECSETLNFIVRVNLCTGRKMATCLFSCVHSALCTKSPPI